MVLVHILPQRIEKIKIELFHKKCMVIGLTFNREISDSVTHIVTALDTVEDVLARVPTPLHNHIRHRCQVLKTEWLSACLKQRKIVSDVAPFIVPPKEKEAVEEYKQEEYKEQISEWACMRDTPLLHSNHHLTDSLEVLEKEAQFRGGDVNYSRALAFRRCMAQLAALPGRVTDIRQVESLPHVGGHCKQVIQEILEDGLSTEISAITESDFFNTMKKLTSVFGVGEATAKKWMTQYNINSVEEACKDVQVTSSKDLRLIYGLAYHKDLMEPVMLKEANELRDLVYEEASAVLPGVIVELVGGFRRGKKSGHDIDLLITHPEEGCELGLLAKLMERLVQRDLHLYGKIEASSYNTEKLSEDTRLTYLKSNLDHFEKFVGILKLDKSFRNKSEHSSNQSDMTAKCLTCNQKLSREETSDSLEKTCPKCNGTSSNSLLLKSGISSKPGENLMPQNEEPPAKVPKLTPDCQQSTDTAENKHLSHDRLRPTFHSLKAEADLPRSWLARRVDLIVSPMSQYYYALVGWTGSKTFNRDLRLYATRVKNMKLTSHALYNLANHKTLSATTEEQVFENLQLKYRPPHLRNA